MISCSKCGYPNPTDNKFCQNCGNKLSELSEKISQSPSVGESVSKNTSTIANSNENIADPTIGRDTEGKVEVANIEAVSDEINSQDLKLDSTDAAVNASAHNPTTVQIYRQSAPDNLDNQVDRPETIPNDPDSSPAVQNADPVKLLDLDLDIVADQASKVNEPSVTNHDNANHLDPDIAEEIDTEPGIELDTVPDRSIDPDTIPTVEIENINAVAESDRDRLDWQELDLDADLEDNPENQIETNLDPDLANSDPSTDNQESSDANGSIDTIVPLPPTNPDRQLDKSEDDQNLDDLPMPDDENEISTIAGVAQTISTARSLENLETAPQAEDNNAPGNSINPVDPVLPLIQLTSLSHAGLSDVGRQRDHNEDAFWARSQAIAIESDCVGLTQEIKGVFVLCDGMGGHESGEVASRTAIDTIAERFTPFWQEDSLPGEQTFADIIGDANQAIFNLNEIEQRRASARMGTTVVVLAVYNQTVAIAHVGDSRIYKITQATEAETTEATEAEISQITQDHEVANQMIEQGIAADIANARLDAHQLTQALGPRANEQVNPSVQSMLLEQNTLFLLCSDGLSDNGVVEQYWRSHLLPMLNPEADLKGGLSELLALGNEINGHDNLSAIVIRCEVEPANN